MPKDRQEAGEPGWALARRHLQRRDAAGVAAHLQAPPPPAGFRASVSELLTIVPCHFHKDECFHCGTTARFVCPITMLGRTTAQVHVPSTNTCALRPFLQQQRCARFPRSLRYCSSLRIDLIAAAHGWQDQLRRDCLTRATKRPELPLLCCKGGREGAGVGAGEASNTGQEQH